MGRHKGKETFRLINELRESCNMRPLEIKRMSCLSCGKSFLSHGIHNRLCNNCRENISRIDDVEFPLRIPFWEEYGQV